MSWKQGSPPDYRFSLANERTFLAWIRTALAFMAAAVGLSQFTPGLGSSDIKAGLVAVLSLTAGSLSCYAYFRWFRNEQAMRLDAELPYPCGLIWLSSGLCVFIFSLLLMLASQ